MARTSCARAGKIGHLGGTNFDTERMAAIVDGGRAARLDAGAVFAARPPPGEGDARRRRGARGVAPLLRHRGGRLPRRPLARAARAGGPLENRSLTKYKLIIDDFGGWDLFQALLAALRRVADRHGSDIATVASAAVLARPGVAAVIVGARNRAHLAANLAIADLALDAADMAAIDAVLAEARPARRATSMRSSATGRGATGRS